MRSFMVGEMVRVLPPFDESFPGEYEITDVVRNPDGTTVYILGELGGFDAIYLEAV